MLTMKCWCVHMKAVDQACAYMCFLRQTVVCSMAMQWRTGSHSTLTLEDTTSPAKLFKQYRTPPHRDLGGSSTTLLAERRREDGISAQSPCTEIHTFHFSRAGSWQSWEERRERRVGFCWMLWSRTQCP